MSGPDRSPSNFWTVESLAREMYWEVYGRWDGIDYGRAEFRGRARLVLKVLAKHPERVPVEAMAAIERQGRVAALTEAADAFRATRSPWAMGVSAWLLERAAREGDPS